MNTKEHITPFVATHPGEVIMDELEARNMKQADLSKKIGIKRSQLNELIKKKRDMNADLAILLEKALGIDSKYWLELQNNYDLDNSRINRRNQKRLEAIEQWDLIQHKIAVSFFKKEKLLNGDPVNDIEAVKEIYAVKSFEELANINAQPSYSWFRKSKKLQVDPVNIIGWVKLVQYKAKQVSVKKFNYNYREKLINKLKGIIKENVNTLDNVKHTLADFGIKLIYQTKGQKTPVDGVSFWSNGNPAIGMTMRYKRLDNFAFTLFHELGHIYKHLINDNKAEFIYLSVKHTNL